MEKGRRRKQAANLTEQARQESSERGNPLLMPEKGNVVVNIRQKKQRNYPEKKRREGGPIDQKGVTVNDYQGVKKGR